MGTSAGHGSSFERLQSSHGTIFPALYPVSAPTPRVLRSGFVISTEMATVHGGRKQTESIGTILAYRIKNLEKTADFLRSVPNYDESGQLGSLTIFAVDWAIMFHSRLAITEESG